MITIEQGPMRWFFAGIGAFAPRDGHGLINFNGALRLYGGWNPYDTTNFPNVTNAEIWTLDAATTPAAWTLTLPSAAWTPRHSFGLQTLDGALYVIGGDVIQGEYQSDVWRSIDGVNFVNILADAPWGDRILHLTASFDGKLWIFGGLTLNSAVSEPTDPDAYYTDAWSSTDGISWVLEAENLPFLPRSTIDQLVEFNGYLWAISGGIYGSAVYYGDVWRSPDGISWELVTDDVPWVGRQYSNVEVFDGRMWLVGGYGVDVGGDTGNIADTWSSVDGINWEQTPSPFTARHAAGLEVFNNQLYLISGNNFESDVWILRPELSAIGTNLADIISGEIADRLVGAAGDDVYYALATNIIIEGYGEGLDTVYVSSNYTLSDEAHVEFLAASDASGTATIHLTGNEFDNHLIGNAGSNTLRGGLGNNILEGRAGDDSYYVESSDVVLEFFDGGYDVVYANSDYQLAAGAHVEILGTTDQSATTSINLTGNALNNYITGNAGSNILSGLGGADYLWGRGGDDIYLADSDDVIIEYAGDGFDTVIVSSHFQLSDGLHVEVLRVAEGAGNITLDLLGNEFENHIYGNAAASTLNGGGGNDRLILGSGAAGSTIDGGADTDTLVIGSSVSSLAGLLGIEALELGGGANLTLTGSQFAAGLASNTAVTGTGSITVNMTAGINFLSQNFAFGGAGVTVTVNGTSGIDIIKSGTGVHIINGGDGVDQIRGGTSADTINGGTGNDKIIGFFGADVITGGTGGDQFRYLFAGDSGLGAGADRITDYAIGSDRLNFALLDTNAGLAGVQGFAFVGNAAFSGGGAASIRYANSGADLLVQADINGDGIADMEIILQGLNGGTLTAADFIL